MRKSSSFMCVLVVLLAGGAEAQRPMPADSLLAMGAFASLLGAASAWTPQNGCVPFKQIYKDGEDLINIMWGNAFNYTRDLDKAYTMWWTNDYVNPNDAITSALGKSVPNQCHLDYYHKDAPSPEGDNFTECHPWHASSCCHEATVVSVDKIKTGYGPGYEWDRCGPLSQACERFFVEEGCFYECEVNAGLYRRFTDEQHTLCSDAADGATVTLADGSSYTCVVSPWGGNSENKWELYKMPISAAYADAWHRACANDLFCGGGDYFACAGDFHAQLAEEEAAENLAAEVLANRTRAAEEKKVAAEAAAAANAALADEANQKAKDNENSIPTWGIVLIAIAGALAIVATFFAIVMMTKEMKGTPIFTQVNKSSSASDSVGQVSTSTGVGAAKA